MKGNKGFTLVELIAVIIILGLLLLIAIPTFQGSLNMFRDDFYKNMEDNVMNAGRDFFLDNRLYLPNKVLYAQKVDVYTLNQSGYINELKDYNDNACSNLDSYVIAIKTGKNKYVYETCIKCLDDDFDTTKDNKYCSSGWTEDGGFTSVTFTKADDVHVYKGTPSSSLSSLVKVYPYLVRCVGTSTCEEELMSVSAYGEDGVSPISPTNLSSINTSTVGTYTVNYSYNGSTVSGNVIVYEHNAPSVVFSKGEDFNIPYDPTSATDWVNRVKVNLNYTFEDYDSGVYVSRYETYRNGRWELVCAPNREENNCYGIINGASDNTLKLRFVDTKDRVSQEVSYTINVDGNSPTCSITDSNATCTDTGGSKITRVYYGNKSNPKLNDYEEISGEDSVNKNMSGEETGTYYLVVMDGAGNKSNTISYTR